MEVHRKIVVTICSVLLVTTVLESHCAPAVGETNSEELNLQISRDKELNETGITLEDTNGTISNGNSTKVKSISTFNIQPLTLTAALETEIK